MRVGEFQLVELLATGGMSEVWSARHRRSGMMGAVKLLATSRVGRDEFMRAFYFEARAHAGLEHASIVTLFDYGAANFGGQERPFLAMELADHTT